MKQHTSTIVQGQQGVHRVVAELIDRGHKPYLPVTDEGIDILLRSGLSIQVKTTRRETQHWRTPGQFLFTLAKAATIRKKTVVAAPARQFSALCDFVVLYAIEANRFWIVPAVVLDGRWTVTIPRDRGQWRACDVAGIQALQAQGHTIEAIADHFNVAPRTITRRLTTYQTTQRRYADLPQYENRWDLITGALATLTEATHIVDSAASAPVGGREHVLTP